MAPTIHIRGGEGYMTIKKLIEKIQEEKPNSFTEEKLISFINEIEVEVAEQLHVSAPVYTNYYTLPKEQPTADEWNNGQGWFIYENGEYLEQTNGTLNPNKTYYKLTELLAPAPYDQLYVSYVKAQIDLANEEIPNYQNNISQHTQDFKDFIDWVVSKSLVEGNPFPNKIINVM